MRSRGDVVKKTLPMILGAVLLLAAAYFLYRYVSAPATVPEEAAAIEDDTPVPFAPDGGAPEAEVPPVEVPAEGDAAPETPPPTDLENSDAYLRETMQGKAAFVDKTLEDQKHLIRKMTTAADLAARGKNPSSQLSFLQPGGALAVDERDGKLWLSKRNYQRYEPMVRAFAALDSDFLAALYRELRPLFLDAYAELGNGDDAWEANTRMLADQVIAMEVPDGEIELVESGGMYIYADPELEALAPVQKALIRMGPENALRLQNKLRELRGLLR